MNIFVTRLNQIKAEKNLSLNKMAEMCGLVPATVKSYLVEATYPNIYVVMEIAKALGVTVAWLCGETDNKYADKKS